MATFIEYRLTAPTQRAGQILRPGRPAGNNRFAQAP
jgi:hypothetical protein